MKTYFLAVVGCLLSLMPQPRLGAEAGQKLPPSRNWATVWGWATASWDGDDRPYQQMRDTIDRAVAGGRKPQELVDLYELPAQRAPDDPKAQFRWAYAAHEAAEVTDYNTGENILSEPRKALVLAPFPHTYQYARLIFLTEDYAVMFVPRLQQVSKRFLKAAPQDTVVKYASAKNLIFSLSPSDRQLAVDCAYQLIQARPQWAKPHGLLGFIYYRQWKTSKNPSDAAKAIEGYERFLDLAPANDPFRPRAQATIAEIRKGEA